MSIRFAFAGFRHFHIDDLYTFAKERDGVSIAAAAEDDEEAAADAKKRGIELIDPSIDALFARADEFDVVAIGDYYGRRGSLAIRALEAGKHVIADKPLCTSPDELTEIEELHRKNRLVIGCMLDNRNKNPYRTVKSLLSKGAIGTLQTICFTGQHPLLYPDGRPPWYFEDGKHGGTINDIGIHAVDVIPWMTGLEWHRVVAARTWNTRLPEAPHFQVGAQVMLELEGEAGVLGDVSYLSPDSQGYIVPQYWRYTFHGNEGVIEAGMKIEDITMWRNGKDAPENVEPEPPRENGVFEDFLHEVRGNIEQCELTSEQVIDSSRIALQIQQAADRKQFPQELI